MLRVACAQFVWKLNKEWLMKVPCFSLVVERLVARPQSGMERFLVKVALSMQPSVFVPTERPPAQRLYIVTSGVAIFRGRKLKGGDSWGAEDVLLRSRALGKSHRAVATTYLHALWVSASTFDELRDLGHEFREAYMLVKLWATIFATGEAMVEDYRRKEKIKQIKIGTGPQMVSAVELETRINAGRTQVAPLKSPAGEQLVNVEGKDLYGFKYPTIDLEGYEIVKEPVAGSGSDFVYRVQRSSSERYATVASDGGALARVAQDAMAKKDYIRAQQKLKQPPSAAAAAPSDEPSVALKQQLQALQQMFTANSEAMNAQLTAMGKQMDDLARENARLKQQASTNNLYA
jgi:hypothetical protein